MGVYNRLADIAPTRIWEGVQARAVHCERLTFSVVELDAGMAIPEHAHDNEQVGMVLRGSMTFTIGGDTREVLPGDTWAIPSFVPHSVQTGSDGAVVVEVFAPGRADWEPLERAPVQTPRWP